MSDPTSKGLSRPSRLPVEWLAGFATALWLAGAALFLLRTDTSTLGPAGALVIAVAVILPPFLIWLAVLIYASIGALRGDTARLHDSVDGMRQHILSQDHVLRRSHDAEMAAKLEAIAAAQKITESAIATFSSRRGAMAPQLLAHQPRHAAIVEQPTLALGTPAEALAAPLTVDELIRALHFPETTEDTDGFAALRRALADHSTVQLIRTAQDVLTTLSQEGIYMDDLRPDPARAEIWRSFAQGARGAQVAQLGGIRDRSCLALTVGRMRQDLAFRDTAHRFVREFDRCLTEFEIDASDTEIARLAQTRSARAFMLLGRVTGIFNG
jgi:hypothetical protein